MDRLWRLHDPKHVARFQRFCGVELVKPGTCDQQTQTKRQNSFDGSETSNGSVGASPSHTTNDNINGSVCNGNGIANGNAKHRNKSGEVKECNNNSFHSDETCSGAAGIYSDDGHLCAHVGASACDSDCEAYIGKKGLSKITSWGSEGFNGVPAKLSPAYTIKYKALLYLAYFGAFLGNEEFYLTFFPFCVWNIDSLMVRQISLLWGMVMYLGQATKDYLCWPRPPCPPVVRLEFSYLQEFSMPSTHAMAGTSIPFYLAHLCIERYQVPIPIAVGLALLWFSITCYSRLFLGVHSILDLLAGIVVSLLLYATFIKYIEDYDMYQQTHRFAPVMVLVTAFMLCTVCYPSQHKISSKGDAVQIVSAIAGFSIGFWLHFQLGYTHTPAVLKPYAVPFPTLGWIGLCALRFLSGLVVLGAFYLSFKPLSIRFFSYLYGLEVPDKNNTNVMTGYKFTTYFSMGIIIAFVIPLIHVWIGIPRHSFFEEVV